MSQFILIFPYLYPQFAVMRKFGNSEIRKFHWNCAAFSGIVFALLGTVIKVLLSIFSTFSLAPPGNLTWLFSAIFPSRFHFCRFCFACHLVRNLIKLRHSASRAFFWLFLMSSKRNVSHILTRTSCSLSSYFYIALFYAGTHMCVLTGLICFKWWNRFGNIWWACLSGDSCEIFAMRVGTEGKLEEYIGISLKNVSFYN